MQREMSKGKRLLFLKMLFAGKAHELKTSVSTSTHFDEFFTVLWCANHLVVLAEHVCTLDFACVCEFGCEGRGGGVNIKLSLSLVQYTSERLINQMTARPIILVNQ